MKKQLTVLKNTFIVTSLVLLAQLPLEAASVKNQRLAEDVLASAQSLVDEQNYSEADKLLTQSMLADPSNASAFALKGRVQFLLENIEEARRLLDFALNISPDNVQAVFWAGQASLALKDFEDTEMRLKRLKWLCDNCENYQSLKAQLAETRTKLAIDETSKKPQKGDTSAAKE